MDLQPQYFRPFDKVYQAVTRRIIARAGQLPPGNEPDWLTQIIADFQRERDQWPHSAELAAYRDQWARLRFRVVWLVASVFLHVSYDLPRVLAENWPATGDWAGGPSEPRAELLYFDLRSIFGELLSNAAGRFAVTGVYAPLLRCVPAALIGNLGHWVGRLREGAWRHGRTLASLADDDRDNTEQRMIEAMTLALRDVNNLPWTFTLPEPPDGAMRSFIVAAPVLVDPDVLGTMEAGLLLISLCLSSLICMMVYASWAWLKTNKINLFVEEFGLRLERYIHLAIYERERFEAIKGASTDRSFSI